MRVPAFASQEEIGADTYSKKCRSDLRGRQIMDTRLCGVCAAAILAASVAMPRPALASGDDKSPFGDAAIAVEGPDCSVDEGDGAFGEVIRKAWRYGVCRIDGPFPLDRFDPEFLPHHLDLA
jgi:hypothetical protein